MIGILIGTYSSIAIAAPILVAYQEWRGERGQKPIAMPVRTGNGANQPKEKVKVKIADPASRVVRLPVQAVVTGEARISQEDRLEKSGSKEDAAGV